MAVLDQLTLASASPKRDMTPLGRFRRKLIDAVDLQLAIVSADARGEQISKKRWVKAEGGSKELRQVPVKARRWWWKDDTGRVFLSVRRGAELLEIAPGKKAIQVDSVEDLPSKLEILREAVCQGELDRCFSEAKAQTRAVPKKPKADTSAASSIARKQ